MPHRRARGQDVLPRRDRALSGSLSRPVPPARGASRARQAPVWEGDAVPAPLLASHADFARWAIKHLNEVVALGERLPHNVREWSRLSSYAITDAHAYTQIMAGTNGAFFQM